MRKTSVYLDAEQTRQLKRLAETEGRSQAEVVREAIALYADQATRAPDRDFAVVRFAETLSRKLTPHQENWRSVADIPEEELLKGFGEDSLGDRDFPAIPSGKKEDSPPKDLPGVRE